MGARRSAWTCAPRCAPRWAQRTRTGTAFGPRPLSVRVGILPDPERRGTTSWTNVVDEHRTARSGRREIRPQQQAARSRIVFSRVSLSAMKSRVQRGRRQLKELVEACCRVDLDRRGGIVGCEERGPGGCRGDCRRRRLARAHEPEITVIPSASASSGATSCCVQRLYCFPWESDTGSEAGLPAPGFAPAVELVQATEPAPRERTFRKAWLRAQLDGSSLLQHGRFSDLGH
jgi:hypothetical protein